MSAAALSTVAAVLWPGLRSVLRRLGRWVLVRLVEFGQRSVLSLMRNRIAELEERRVDAANDAKDHPREAGRQRARIRRRSLDRRLARWRWCAAWIASNAKRLKPAVLRQFEVLAEKIPETAPWELAA